MGVLSGVSMSMCDCSAFSGFSGAFSMSAWVRFTRVVGVWVVEDWVAGPGVVCAGVAGAGAAGVEVAGVCVVVEVDMVCRRE